MNKEKLLFNHYYFNTFKKGRKVYKWARVYDYEKGTTVLKRQDGNVIRKKSFSLTVEWKNYGLQTFTIQEAVESLSLQYEPNDLLKEVL